MGKALNNSIYYTIGAVVKASASFLLLPVFTNKLGAEQYGILSLLQTFSTILATVMTLAVERSLYRLFYDYQTEEEQRCFLSTVFWLICLNSVIVIILTILMGGIIVQYIGDVDVYAVFSPVVIYTFFSALINFSQIIMQVEQKGGQYLKVSLLILIIYNVVALLLVFFYSTTVKSLVYASFVTYLVVTPIAYYKIKEKIHLEFDKKIILSIFKFSSPLLLMIIFSWVLHFSDRLFIAKLVNYEYAGIYSLAAKIVSIITLFAEAVFQAYGPYFYRIANTMDTREAKAILKESNSIITLIICLLGILIVLFSNTVLNLLFSDEYAPALVFIYLLAISMVFTQQSGLLNLMIYQNKKTLGISLITIAAGVLSVVFNYWFIPVYGAVMAGITNLVVGILMITLTFLLARRNYYISVNIPLLLYAVILMLLYAVCDYMIDSHWLAMITKLCLLGAWVLLGRQLGLINLGKMNGIVGVLLEKIHIY